MANSMSPAPLLWFLFGMALAGVVLLTIAPFFDRRDR